MIVSLLFQRLLLLGLVLTLIGICVQPLKEAVPVALAQTIPPPTHQLWLPNVQRDYSNQSVTSPNGQLRLHFQVDVPPPHIGGQNQLHYSVSYRGATILEPSLLGLTFAPSTTALGSLEIFRISVRSHDAWYTMPFAERRNLHDQFNEMTVYLREAEVPHRELQLIFRAYDAGVALRYLIPFRSDWESIQLTGERTAFTFPTDSIAYMQWGTEGVYQPTQLSAMQGRSETPLTITNRNDQNAPVMSITEAHVDAYPRMVLERHPTENGTLTVGLEGNAILALPFQSPWRVLMVADSAASLLNNNDLLYHLSPPSVVADTSWIRPGKAMRIGPLNTAAALEVIDFAAAHGIEYVEYDVGWYPNGYWAEFDPASDATKVVDEIDMPQVIDYATQRGIGLLLYVNYVALRQQLGELLPLYQAWGVKGIKFGYVDGRTQNGIRFLHSAIQKAAEHQLLIDIHDNYRPSGMSRTYPNLLTQEGVRGNEHFTGADYNTTLPFTRLLAGAADHTFPYYTDRLNVTRAHQLAAMVVIFSPLQFVFWYDAPVDYGGEAELDYIGGLPTVWDETVVLDGAIGETITVARRSGQAWYVGTLTNTASRTVAIPLTFLTAGKSYQARIYRDEAPTAVAIESSIVTGDMTINATMLPSGGHAMWLVPAE